MLLNDKWQREYKNRTCNLRKSAKKLKYHILCQVINISSPNTPGLRQLQERKQLKDLVKKV